MVSCKICSAPAPLFGRARVLDRHDVAYYRCDACGFVQTEEPYWLEAAYSGAIAPCDIGLVQRNLRLAAVSRSVIRFFFDAGGRFLDYAGGYGLMVRLMRDAGYDFHLYDKYCDNIFAKGFAVEGDDLGGFELVTAFELLEHMPDPAEGMERLLAFSRNVLFSTELLPPSGPAPGQWWYYGLDHGQHVCIFTVEALKRMAAKFSLNLYTDGRSIHLLTEKKPSRFMFNVALRHPFGFIIDSVFRKPSLLWSDYAALQGKRNG